MSCSESARTISVHRLFRAYVHTHSRRRIPRPEPKSDVDRANLGLPLREPWFEVKPFDEKKMRFVLSLKDILQGQPKQKIDLTILSQLRRELDVHRQGKQRKMATYIRWFPGVFKLQSFFTPTNSKKQWCSFSAAALKLLEEEEQIFEASEGLHVQNLRKTLMISMKNRLPVAAVDKVRQILGFPVDYKERLVKKYPEVFLLKERKGFLYIELKEWDKTLAISSLKKNTQEGKYEKKKKRDNRLSSEENDEGVIRDADYEHASPNEQDCHASPNEQGCQVSMVEGRGYQEMVTKGCDQDSAVAEHERILFETNEEKMCWRQSPEFTELRKGVSVVEGNNEELSNARLFDQEYEAVSSSNNSCQETAAIAGPVFVDKTDLSLESSSEDSFLMIDNELDASTAIETRKDDEQQITLSAFGESKKIVDEKLSETSCSAPENSHCLRFPWVLKKGKQPRINRAFAIESFQSLPYVSPYENSRQLVLADSQWLQADKFVVGMLHEFLSLTVEKRATIQQLELFQRPYRLPINLLAFLLKYDGIFYVARGTTKAHVFLKEAYKEFDLREKEPLLLWQERFVKLAFSSLKSNNGKGQ